MAHKTLSPASSPLYKYNKNKDARLERIPFDQTSKYLDSLFAEEKDQALNAQFQNHARDQYKCFCQICLKKNPNLQESSPNKTSKSFYISNTSPFRNTHQSFHQQNLQASNGFNACEANVNIEHFGKLNETGADVGINNNYTDNSPSKNHDTDLNFILKRLVPPQRIQRTLRVFVPETVLFWNGEAKLLVHTNYKDSQLKFIKQKEKLQLNEIRKFFNERRTKYRQLVEQKLEEMRIFGPNEARFIKRPQEIKLFDTSNSTPTNKNESSATNQKDQAKFSHVKKSKLAPAASGDSSKNSASPYSAKQNQASMGMNDSQVKNDVKRSRSITNRPSELQIGGQNGINNQSIQTIENKDAIIYKLDSFSKYDQDHTTVINESDFLTLMMKRKIDPIWSNVHYIQNIIKVKKNKFQYQHYFFIYEDVKDDELFYRAFKDIQILNGEISSVSSEFVPIDVEEEFETRLMYDQIVEYQKYITCKIFHFLQTFHSVTLETLETEWLQDDTGALYLVNCKNISYTSQGRTYITTEMYYKRIEEKAEKKLKLKEGLEEKYKDYRKDAIQKLSDDMMKNYEAKKKKLGILQQKKTREEVDISDEVFQKIYPEIKFKLSDLLKTDAPIKILQQEILGEKNISLREKIQLNNSQMFSKVYLSPSKQKGLTEQNSLNNSFTMRQTFSIMNRTNPPHRRIFSASNKRRNEQQYSNTKDSSNGFYTTAINNLIENSPTIQIVKQQATSHSTTKKWLKVKKKTLPYYLFCSYQ
ncbi:hypothetical protein ABPG74_003605 [Tetrahymena malaccensis]